MGWVRTRVTRARRGVRLGRVPHTEPMTGNREPRGVLLLVVAGAVVLLLAAGLLVVAAIRGVLPGTADCVVEVGGRPVELQTGQAEVAATGAAQAVRERRGPGAATARVAEAADLPAAD